MSLPLKDVRSQIDEDTDSLLDAHANVRGVTKSEVIRDILREWTQRQLALHEAMAKELARSGRR